MATKKKRVFKRELTSFVRLLKKGRKKLKPADMDGIRQQAHSIIDIMYSDEILFKAYDLFVKTLEVMVVLGDDYEDFSELIGQKILEHAQAEVTKVEKEKINMTKPN